METKTRPLYMLSTRDPLQNKGHIQTKSEGLEKNISCKWRPKESRSCNTQIRLSNKGCEKRQRRTLHNDQRIKEEDITIIYASNIGAPQYVRHILMSMKEEINSNTIIVGGFNTPLTTMDRSTNRKLTKKHKL